MRRGLSFSRDENRARDVAHAHGYAGVATAAINSITSHFSSAFPAAQGASDTAAAAASAAAPVTAQSAPVNNGTLEAAAAAGAVVEHGAGSTSGIVHTRRPSRFSRYHSVEDELWGWFGDDRPPSDVGGNSSFSSSHGIRRESSSDLLFRTSSMSRGLHGTAGARGGSGVGIASSEGFGTGGDTDITVSTLALTERLAKLSVGRALLDKVRAESRSLVELVSSAARSIHGDGQGGAGDLESDAIREVSRSAGRGVTIVEPAMAEESHRDRLDSTPTRSTAEHELQTVPEGEGNGGEQCLVIEIPDGENTEVDLSGDQSASEAPGDGHAGAERDSASAENETMPGSACCDFRRTVIEARAELEALQKDLRQLVRDGGDLAKQRVALLVAQRAEMAKKALPGAQKMAERLQEIAEAQRVRIVRGE